MNNEPFYRTQFVLGMVILAMLLLSALAFGGNRPVVWSLLSVAVLTLFLFQVVISFVLPVPLALRTLMLPGVLFLGVIVWGWVQTLAGIPDPYAHPLWLNVPGASPSISADPGQGRQAMMRLLCYAMIFVMTVWTCIEARRATVVLLSIAVFSTALAVYGLWSFSTGENVLLGDLAAPSRLAASFVNENNYATYAVFGVLANLAACLHLLERQPDTVRGRLEGFFSGAWIFALGTLLCIGAVSLTQSRAGAVAGLGGLGFFLLAWRGSAQRRLDLILLLLLSGTLIFIAMTSATGLTERLLATSEEAPRFRIYPSVIEAIADRPWLGHGAGAFLDAFRPYVPQDLSGFEWYRAHSTHLELAFGLGLPAVAGFFLALGLIVWRIYRGTRERRTNRAFSCFAIGAVATAAFHSVFDFSLQMPAAAALFAAILGLGYGQSFTTAEIKAARAKIKAGRDD